MYVILVLLLNYFARELPIHGIVIVLTFPLSVSLSATEFRNFDLLLSAEINLFNQFIVSLHQFLLQNIDVLLVSTTSLAHGSTFAGLFVS